MNCIYSDSESSSDDESDSRVGFLPAPVPPLYQPYDKHQGFFLANLAKMLDEAEQLKVEFAFRWHPEEPSALQVRWPLFVDAYDILTPVLSAYKLVRRANNVASARASWNRKLREWSFIMAPARGSQWTTYTYPNKAFHSQCDVYALPLSRRAESRKI